MALEEVFGLFALAVLCVAVYATLRDEAEEESDHPE